MHYSHVYRIWQPEERWMLLTSSEKGENEAKNRGVNTILSPESYKAMTLAENINTCIMTGSV